ncbi:MAG TPA: hypothetical protein VKU19_18745 [Bryobacteraceae bacterium]|nr:hypothetical protein [Bryobacteraceae bacterium]
MTRNYAASLVFATVFLMGTGANAQSARRAGTTAAANSFEGRCVVSVLVYGLAEVEIQGETATLLKTPGPSAELQRFACTAPVPESIVSLHVRATEGLGRLTLEDNTESRAAAIVRIDNANLGEAIYTFEVSWPLDRSLATGDADRLSLDDASAESCRTAAENRIRKEGYHSVHFDSVSTDNRGANPHILGTVSATGVDGVKSFQFSCFVDPATAGVSNLEVTRR